MSDLRVINRDPASGDKEVTIQIDPVGSGGSGDFTYHVKGKMVDARGQGVSDITVKAYHRGLTANSHILLGEITSNSSGDYLIYYNTSQLPSNRSFADLLVVASDSGGTELARSPIFTNARPEEIINLSVASAAFIGNIEYDVIKAAIDPEISGATLAEIDTNGIAIISSATGFRSDIILAYLKSISFNQKYPTVIGEAFYGFFRYGLTYVEQDLLNTSEARLREALESTQSSRIIDPDLNINDILSAFANLRAQSWLIDPVDVSGSYLARILNIAGVTDTGEQEGFAGAYLSYGEDATFWDQLITEDVFADDSGSGGDTPQEKVDKIKMALQIGVITQEHTPLVEAIFGDINNIEEIASFTLADWTTYVSTHGIPNVETANITTEDQENYQQALFTATEHAFPTEVLIQSMSNDSAYSSSDAYTFLTANPDFDIKTSGPRGFFAGMGTEPDATTKEAIYDLRRRWFLATGPERLNQIKLMEVHGLNSAAQIASYGKRNFIKQFGTESIFGEKEAERIYNTAVKRAAAATKLQTDYNPNVNNISTAVYRDPSLENPTPTLEELFGSQDYCACKHCQSSFGPAAYLIDLLTFLQRSEAHDDTGTPTGQSAWDLFQSRRPELLNLELSCENTNKLVPYIDLVNEVLEYEVAATGNLFRQTSFDENTLRVRPEHLNRVAYDKLHDGSNESVNGLNLPFHLWNEEAEAYLNLVGLSRLDLGLSNASNSTYYFVAPMPWRTAVNLSGVFNTVLSDSSTFTKYYGGADTATLQNVRTLIEKSGISYEELQELMESQFINPSGKSMVFDPIDSCNLEDATLAFVDVEYRNLHRFEKLRRFLDWTVEELDTACAGLGVTSFAGSVGARIYQMEILTRKFNVERLEALSWVGSLSENSYSGRVSRYESIFLNPQYHTDNTTIANFAAPTVQLLDGIILDSINSPVVLGACNLQADELLLLIQSEISDGANVSRSELSFIYGVASFCRVASLSIQEFLDFNQIVEHSTVRMPAELSLSPLFTMRSLAWLQTLREVRMSISDLSFLFLHKHLETYKLTGNHISEALNVSRSFVQERLKQKGMGHLKSREDLLNLFLIFMNEEESSQSVEIVDQVSNDAESIANADLIIDTVWSPYISDIANTKTQLTAGGGTLTGQDRIDAVFEQFLTSLISEVDLESEFYGSLEGVLDASPDMIKSIIQELGGESLFFSSGFLFSSGSMEDLTNYSQISAIYIRARKISLVIQKLNIRPEYYALVINGKPTSGWYDLSNIPITTTTSNITDFINFMCLIDTALVESKRATASFSVFGAVGAGTLDTEQLAAAFGISQHDAEVLDQRYPIGNPERFLFIERAAGTIRKTGMSTDQIALFTFGDVTYELSQTLQSVLKSRFSDAEWKKMAAEVRDKLRVKQRNSLSNYLIQNRTEYGDTNSLFGHFLIDTEMSPCMMTSRLKLAISSVQLWVQRIRMKLETGINFLPEQLEEWEWRKNYRVWEAARKVFLYPENWIEPELRDDKSPFFRNLEEELISDEVTAKTAENAYLGYLNKLDETSILEISGIFREEDLNNLHVFARTKNAPHSYFYRRREDGFRWTAWESMDLEIEGEHLIPVIFNRRPMLFWPVFSEIPQEVTNDDLRVETSGGQVTSDISGEIPVTYAEIKIAFSEWKNGKWQAKKLSKTRVISQQGFEPSNYFFKVAIGDGNRLRIDAYYHTDKSNAFSHVGGFVMDNCTAEVVADLSKQTVTPATFSVKNAYRNNMKMVEEGGNDQLAITEKIYHQSFPSLGEEYNVYTDERVLLNQTPGTFRITYPVTGADLLSEVPFFFEDGNRVFFVEPSDQSFERDDLISLPPRVVRVRRKVPILTPTGIEEQNDNRIENIANESEFEIRNTRDTSVTLDDITDRRIVFY